MERLELGPVPCNEHCQQVGTKDYDPVKARAECKAYIHQLERQFGQSDDWYFGITSNPHDFGTYYEVCVKYTPAGQDKAFEIEADLPSDWDEAARKELGL